MVECMRTLKPIGEQRQPRSRSYPQIDVSTADIQVGWILDVVYVCSLGEMDNIIVVMFKLKQKLGFKR